MVDVLIKWDVQETYILRYLLHCHEESESYTTLESRCLDSGLEKLIREPQSAQKTIPDSRCVYVPSGSLFGQRFRRRCALSHVSWSMIASRVFLNTILSSGVAARRFFMLEVFTNTFAQHRMPKILLTVKNIGQGGRIPSIGVVVRMVPSRFRMILFFICRRDQHFFIRKSLANLCKTGTAGCHIEDSTDNGSGFFVHIKRLLITGNPFVPVGNTATAPFTVLHPGLEHRTNFCCWYLWRTTRS